MLGNYTCVVNIHADFLAIEALISVCICIMHFPATDASMNPTSRRHYFTLEDTSMLLVTVYSNVIRCHCPAFEIPLKLNILLTTRQENQNEVLNYCKHSNHNNEEYSQEDQIFLCVTSRTVNS